MEISCYNHYPAPLALELHQFTRKLRKVYSHLKLQSLSLVGASLETLKELEFNLVDDQTMIQLHEEFLQDGTTTDVITFQHGEVFVCYDVARREAEARAISLEEELFRYYVHGLLHLAGYEDQEEVAQKKMLVLQECLVGQYF